MTMLGELSTILGQQHQLIAQKVRDVSNYRGEEKQFVFDDLRRYLAAHDAAEQTFRRGPTPQGTATDPPRVHSTEIDEIAQLMVDLEGLGIDSGDFVTRFGQLGDVLTAHGLIEAAAVARNADDTDLDRILLTLRMVPDIVAGSGHSVTMTPTFTYAELLELATATINGLLKDPTTHKDSPK